jgi:SAM-dependent methyltransferase
MSLLERIVRRLNRLAKLVLYKIVSTKHQCNICGWRDNQFNSDGWHDNSICPNCGSQVRHRLLWASLDSSLAGNMEEVIQDKELLHFAPDKFLRNIIQGKVRKYVTADFFAEGYTYPNIDMNLDISDMGQVNSNTFDCVIAMDVLEHVQNDKKAIQEVFRILKPNGYFLITVPQKDNTYQTYEDENINKPEDRERIYGQWDHLRIYGSDFKDLLEQYDFKVEIIDHEKFEDDLVKNHILFPSVLSESPVATNFRKIYFARKPI